MSQLVKKKCAVYIILNYLRHNKNKRENGKHRRYWTTKLYQYRSQSGGENLLRTLAIDETTGQFKNFLRMSQADFQILLNLVGPKIKKMDTNFRKAISVQERLALTLRFLATGDSYSSLQYLFKISKQAISEIVPEVCSALIDSLKDYIKVRF